MQPDVLTCGMVCSLTTCMVMSRQFRLVQMELVQGTSDDRQFLTCDKKFLIPVVTDCNTQPTWELPPKVVSSWAGKCPLPLRWSAHSSVVHLAVAWCTLSHTLLTASQAHAQLGPLTVASRA